jgi:hypothetical protein
VAAVSVVLRPILVITRCLLASLERT